MKKICLDIGCGDKEPKNGFVGIDIRKFDHIDYVCTSWEINKYFSDNIVDEIYSRHCFEHLTYYQADLTLNSWYNALKKGGKLNIIVPDLEYHFKQVTNTSWFEPSDSLSKVSNIQHAICSIFGWQNESVDGAVWDIHKSGYNFELLKLKLESFGFTDITRLEDEKYNLNIEAHKGEVVKPLFYNNFNLRGYEQALFELSPVKVLVENLKDTVGNKKVALYGAGSSAQAILNSGIFSELNIVGILDGDPKKDNTIFSGLNVYCLDKITELNPEVIIISVQDTIIAQKIKKSLDDLIKSKELNIQIETILKNT
jgi:predicted SAM-dependent methyltransferase